MKLIATNYVSPIPTEGNFPNTFIEETSFQLKRIDSYLRVDFEMYYFREDKKIVIGNAYIVVKGLDSDVENTNRTATFFFNSDPNTIIPLMQYVEDNLGEYPTDFTMVDWGFPTYEQAVKMLLNLDILEPEMKPINAFVEEWVKNTITMKGELIGEQFLFVQ